MADNYYQAYTDMELVALVNDGDQLAFREIYQRYFPVMHVHAFKRIDDNEAVKDMLQDVFTAFWHNRAEIHVKRSLSAYLYAAVRYKTTNYLLQQSTANKYLDSLQHHVDALDTVQADFGIRHKELSQIIESEINALPPAMRQIFVMSRVELMSHRDIASTLQLSDQTVRTQIKKALRILRRRLPLMVYIILCSKSDLSFSPFFHQHSESFRIDRRY